MHPPLLVTENFCLWCSVVLLHFQPMSATCDFALSQALDGPTEPDEQGSESSCFNMTDVQEEICKLDEGLDLVISYNRTSMRGVANLVLAANRTKKATGRLNTPLSDAEPCSTIMGSLVEERVVTITNRPSTEAPKPAYLRINSRDGYVLSDNSQKVLVKGSGLNLQAVTLKGGNQDHRVNFKLAQYIPSSVSDGDFVVLSIRNTNLHLSCSMTDGRATLKLEECSRENLQTIGADGNTRRFLFERRLEGLDLFTFESVRCSGWFISTSFDKENEAVDMCEADAVCRYRRFKKC